MRVPIPESEKAPVVSLVLTSAHPPDPRLEGDRGPNVELCHKEPTYLSWTSSSQQPPARDERPASWITDSGGMES